MRSRRATTWWPSPCPPAPDGSMKRALVTGATGMLGGYVVERLLAGGLVACAGSCGTRRGAVGRGARARQVVRGRRDRRRVACAPPPRGCDAIVPRRGGHRAGPRLGALPARQRRGHRERRRGRGGRGQPARPREQHLGVRPRTATSRRPPTSPAAARRSPPATPTAAPSRRPSGSSWPPTPRAASGPPSCGRPMMYGRRDRQFVPRVGPVLERGAVPAGRRRHDDALPRPRPTRSPTAPCARPRPTRPAGRVYHLTNDFALTVADLVTLRRPRARPPRPRAAARPAGRGAGGVRGRWPPPWSWRAAATSRRTPRELRDADAATTRSRPSAPGGSSRWVSDRPARRRPARRRSAGGASTTGHRRARLLLEAGRLGLPLRLQRQLRGQEAVRLGHRRLRAVEDVVDQPLAVGQRLVRCSRCSGSPSGRPGTGGCRRAARRCRRSCGPRCSRRCRGSCRRPSPQVARPSGVNQSTRM